MTDEEYRDVECDFLEEFEHLKFDSQYCTVFRHLIPKIRHSAEADRLNADEYCARLQEAKEIVDDLESALSPAYSPSARV